MRLDQVTLGAVTRLAEAAYPYEACGLIRRSGEVVAIGNLLEGTEAGRVRFEMAPADLLRALREGEPAVLFHSHCDAPARFSEEDAEALSPGGVPLYPQAVQLVVSVRGGRVSALTAYRWAFGTWTADCSVLDASVLQPR